MKRNYIAAAAVAVAFALWLLSGQLGQQAETGPAPALSESRQAMMTLQEDTPTRVRARVVRAQLQTADVVVRGRTEADRAVELRAQTSGRVVDLPRDQGDRVAAGDVICRIEDEERAARLQQAEERVRQNEIEFEGFSKLSERGFQSETAIATARANLATARADLEFRRIDLARTEIRAPFDGIVETRPAEIGDLLQVGSVCASVIDPDPMLLVGEVAERDVARVEPGIQATGRLITGDIVTGEVAFVAQTANPSTRTYRVEVRVPNPDLRLRGGITTEIRVPVETIRGHRIPAALLALDDRGDMGVRIVDEDDVVQFVYVDIIKDTPEGLWVAGLPELATIITVGQELVAPGETVEVSYEATAEMPAAAPEEIPEAEAVAEPATGAADDLTTIGGSALSAAG